MAFKHYNRLLILRLILIVLIPVVIGFLIADRHSLVLIIGFSAAEVFLIIEFIHFLNRSNRQISFFIQAIKNDDTTLRFPIETGNAVLNDLHLSLNELNVILQETKVKSQIRERYVSEILQNIGTGVRVCNEKGFITEVNPAALELIGLQTLTHVSQLDRVDPHFKTDLMNLGNLQKQVITINKQKEQIQLITRCSVINLKNEDVRLITLQDIRGELERKELDSWVKLIRVLNHEIMNSLAPVTSIAQSLKEIWKRKIPEGKLPADDEAVESTIKGLEVIGEQGEGLLRFVQSYRMLTKVPEPRLTAVSIESLFDRLSILVSPVKADFGVAIRFQYPQPGFQVTVDEQMMVQAVINVIKNAAEALGETGDPLIEIACYPLPKNETELTVTDNGPGIPDEIQEEIFVPFFTTKTNGTGIGLSLARQNIRAHGGTLSCSSRPGKTVFKLRW